MNTVTHVLVNAAIDRRVREQRDGGNATGEHPIATKAFLWGGAAPDLPLIAMTAGAMAWFPLRHGWSLGRSFEHIFRNLYFENPAWIAANNLLQSPTMLLLMLAGLVLLRRRRPAAAHSMLWFLLGAVVHVALDIPVHHDDGPLLFFPFQWTIRFQSPVSYWDPRHYGDIVRIVELVLMVALVLYLLRPRLRRWFGRTNAGSEAGDRH